MTMATIGRLMKNFDISLTSAWGRQWQLRSRRRPWLRIHGDALLCFLDAFDDDAVTGLNTFLHDPLVIDPAPHFHRLDMNFVIRTNNCNLVAALELGHRALRHEQRIF